MRSEGDEAAHSDHWRIELLGGLRVQRGDRSDIRFPTEKTALLLAYLAYYPQRPHPRDVLVDLLWPEIAPDAGRGSFRVALHALRRILEPVGAAGTVLIADRSTVALQPTAFTSDAADMRGALEAARACVRTDERLAHLQRATTLYRGELLPGYHESWILTERRHLEEQFLGALHEQALALEEIGHMEGALDVARRAIAADPLREEAHFHLMRLYATAGQPLAALRQFQELERILREELGEKPSETARVWVQELRERARGTGMGTRERGREGGRERRGGARTARAAAIPAAPTPVPPSLPLSLSPSSPSPPRRLPTQLTRFVAREEEIAWVAETLGYPDVRLLTLTGPGGTGKTRLAIAAAWRLAQTWEGPVWFVPLADVGTTPFTAMPRTPAPDAGPTSTPARITDMIATVLGLSRTADATPFDQVVEMLGRQPSLLILDNFEHLVEEGALLVHHLLERVPTLTCLVTSRQHLDLGGEHAFPVGPLATPGSGVQVFRCSGVQADDPVRSRSEHLNTRTPEHLMQCASVQLFVDRARAVSPAFQIDAENAAAIAAVCDRLEGLPLALELAAVWVRMLTPEQILERLSRPLDLLVGQRRDLTERQRSLRGAMEWSYRLLAPELQRFFVQMAAFRGGWTVEAAEAVTGEGRTLEHLRQLQECSLLQVELVERSMRYRLLETVREFAVEQLERAEQQALGRRHARCFLALMEQAGADEVQRLQWVRREQDNLRAVLDWSRMAAAEVGDPAAASDTELGLALCCALETFWVSQCSIPEGREYLTALLSRPDLPPSVTLARALTVAGRLAYFDEGHSPVSRRLLEDGLELARALDEKALAARILVSFADEACGNQQIATGRAYYEEALALYRASGHKAGMATVLASLAISYGYWDPPRTIALYEECIAIFRETGSQSGMAWVLLHLASFRDRQGEYALAATLIEESVTLFRQLGERIGMASGVRVQGMVALAMGDTPKARRCFEEVMTICYEVGGEPNTANAFNYFGEVALVEGDIDQAEAYFRCALPLARTKDDPNHIALALVGLGRVALRRGDGALAAELLRESYHVRRERPNLWDVCTLVEALAAAALLGASPAHALHAARWFGAVQALRDRLGIVRPPHEQQHYDAQIAALRQTLDASTFSAAWEAGAALPWDEVVASALGQW